MKMHFLAIVAFFFQTSVFAQTNATNTCHSDVRDRIIDEIEAKGITGLPSLMHNQSFHLQNSESKTSYVPVIVFGLSGMFLGAWTGHAIEDKEDVPGEIPEVFTKGTVIGAGVGVATGVTIGYLLARRGNKSQSVSPETEVD